MFWHSILTLITPLFVLFLLIYLGVQNKLDRYHMQSLLKEQQKENQEQRHRFDQHQIKSLALIQDSLQKALVEIHRQVADSFKQHIDTLNKQINTLTCETQKNLKEISNEVDKRLTKGFEKTTATFTDIVKRLTIIDQAQQKITELSSNVMSLQDILNDKRSRGAFGEVQLNSLIRNLIPESNFSMQHTLSNGKRVDCLLILPKPTGNIAIDAKFPLESYQHLMSAEKNKNQHHHYQQQFRFDIRKHISDIAEKYIIPDETADGAVMFIPAESIFAEIHSHYPELVEKAHQARVWLVSPTTLMAILTSARAVLKDQATRKQVHIIQQHLVGLSKDFERFQKRMNSLARHIGQAHEDVEKVHKSSQKISSRFDKIEKVELTDIEDKSLIEE